MIRIRKETAADATAVRYVNEQAFGGSVEADLVEALRRRDAVTLSLVAIRDGAVVGHILFSPVEIASEDAAWPAVALGPMAVLPTLQRKGIGGRLVERGLEELRDAGHGVVIVLGHAEYYPRFGFVPASRFGIRCEFEVPDEVFMALELRTGECRGRGGTARYRPEFHAE